MAKIKIRLEKGDKFIERTITQKEICALYDLHFMFEPNFIKMMEINGIDKHINKFMNTICKIDEAMHDGVHYCQKDKDKIVKNKNKKEDWLYGVPQWKNAQNETRKKKQPKRNKKVNNHGRRKNKKIN